MAEKQVNYINAHEATVKRQATRTAADSAGFLIPHLEKLPPDFQFLDLGCGPGSITLDLAQRFPQATFLGIDVGEAPIAKATASLEEAQNIKNVTFRVGNILKLTDDDLPWGTYDAVYCHQVLLHMQEPIECLKVMKRAAKPNGGIAAAKESFTSGQLYYPDETGMMQKLKSVMAELLRRNGSDPDIGVKLIEKAKEAGWNRDQIDFSFSAWGIVTQEARAGFAATILSMLGDPNSGMRRRAREAGLLDDETVEKAAQAMRDWLGNDAACANYVNGDLICVNGP